MAPTLALTVWISCICPLVFPTVIGPGAAQTLNPGRGDQVASLRLIAAPRLPDGRYAAGVEIVMAPGSHTYWKQPGEAGVPPVFAFNGSENVATAEVRFPTPHRISEEGIEAFGYADQVIFPVVVTPVDPAKPAVLKAAVNYAVCNKICIPAHGDATIALAPGGRGLDGARVTAALAEVPHDATAEERRDLVVTPESGTAAPTWTVTWSGATPIRDLFAVAPDGFYFTTTRIAPSRFRLVATETVIAAAATPVPVTLTVARATNSLVVTETLDVRAARR